MPKQQAKTLTKVRSKSDKAAKQEKNEPKELTKKDKSRSKSHKKEAEKAKKPQSKKRQTQQEGENILAEKGDIKIDIRTSPKKQQNPPKAKESKSPQKSREKSKKSHSQEAKKAKNVGRDEKKETKKEKKTEPKKKEHKKHLERSRSKSIKKENDKIKTKKELEEEKKGMKTPEKSNDQSTPVPKNTPPSSSLSARSSSKSQRRSRSRSNSKEAVVVSTSEQKRSNSTSKSVDKRESSKEQIESEKRTREITELRHGTMKAAKKKPTQKKRQNLKKVQEISSENMESSSSIDLALEQKKHKTDVSYSPNFKKEIKEAIAKIEKKRRTSSHLDSGSSYITRKRKRDDQVAPRANVHTASDFDFILQKNPNSKSKPIVDLVTLSNHKLINYSDVLLAMFEVANNADNYLFAYSAKSKSFWNDILQYKVLKKIFVDFKAETLRKYWTELSKFDPQTATDLIKKHKKYLDNLPLKLGTIVTSISKYLDGKIKNFQEYINNIQIDIRKREVFEHEFKNPVTGDVTKIRDVRTIYNTRRKYEPGKQKNFTEPQINIIALQEIYQHTTKKTDYQNVMEKLNEEDYVKYDYLNRHKDEQKKILQSINESHKFIFKTVDSVLDALSKEFSNYSKEFILEMLQQNSMDVTKTYLCLKDSKKAKELAFTPLDDKVILNMKNGEEFKILLNEKGKAAIAEREEYLKGN